MLLFFRFFLMMLASRFRSRIGPLDESVVRFTVLPNDCDVNIHLNGGRFLSFMDISRADLIARTGLLRPMLKRGWRPVMGGAVVRYRREIRPFERFRIRSRVIGWDEKWFYVEHIVEKQKDTFCAIGHARTVIRGKGGTIRPSEVLTLVGAENTPSPELPEFVRHWSDAENTR